MERYGRIFENYSGDVEVISWEKFRFWAALWASFSPALRDMSYIVILLDWRPCCRIVSGDVLQCKRVFWFCFEDCISGSLCFVFPFTLIYNPLTGIALRTLRSF